MPSDEMITISVGDADASACIVLPRHHEIVRLIEQLLPMGIPTTRSSRVYDRSRPPHARSAESPTHPPTPRYTSLLEIADDSPPSEYSSTRSPDARTPGYVDVNNQRDRKDRVKPANRRRYRRCCIAGCDKIAVSRGVCRAHGGGRRCQQDGCPKSAQSGGDYCWSHGGGLRCRVSGCSRKPTSNQLCRIHGNEWSRAQSSSPEQASETRAVDAFATLPSLRDMARHPVVFRL